MTRRAAGDGDADPEPLLWTVKQTAQALAVSEWTVRGLHRTGRLRGVIVCRNLRFRPADVRAFVERLGAEEG